MKISFIWDIVRWKSTDVSEEHIASIFRIEEQAMQEASLKQTPHNHLKSYFKAWFSQLLATTYSRGVAEFSRIV
jgi:hypothetical protein